MHKLLLQRALVGAGVGLVLVALPVVALAQTGGTGGGFPTGGAGSSLPSGGAGPVQCGSGHCAVSNPLGGTTSVCGLLKNLFNGAVAILIPVAVLFIIWSGFQFVLAQGNSKQLQKARKNFMFTVIGIAVFLGAWLLADVIAATVNAIGGSSIISCQ